MRQNHSNDNRDEQPLLPPAEPGGPPVDMASLRALHAYDAAKLADASEAEIAAGQQLSREEAKAVRDNIFRYEEWRAAFGEVVAQSVRERRQERGPDNT